MKKLNKLSKIIVLTAVIVAITTYTLINKFLSGEIIHIPQLSLEGGIIAVAGYVAIIITTTGVSLVVLLLLKRKFLKAKIK